MQKNKMLRKLSKMENILWPVDLTLGKIMMTKVVVVVVVVVIVMVILILNAFCSLEFFILPVMAVVACHVL
jgi:hypothetical protein